MIKKHSGGCYMKIIARSHGVCYQPHSYPKRGFNGGIVWQFWTTSDDYTCTLVMETYYSKAPLTSDLDQYVG